MAEKVMTAEEYKKAMALGVFLKTNIRQNAGDPISTAETPVKRLERQGFPVSEELRRTYG